MIQYYFNPKDPSVGPSTDSIVRIEDSIVSFIPISEQNRDYRAYLEWVAEGNEAPIWDPSILD